MRLHKPSSVIIISLAIIILTWFLLKPSVLQTPIANNIWSINFIKRYETYTQDFDQEVSYPQYHSHASMLFAIQALEQNEYSMALDLIIPSVGSKDNLVQNTYADILYLNKDYPQALKIWRSLGEYSKLEHAAREFDAKDDIDNAILAWNYAYEIKPGTYQRNLIAYKLLKANSLLESEQIESSIFEFQDIILMFPEDGRAYSGLASAYWLDHQHELSIKIIETGWQYNAGNASFYLNAGRIFEEAGQLANALNAYKKTLEIAPDNLQANQAVLRLSGSN